MGFIHVECASNGGEELSRSDYDLALKALH